MNTNSKLLIEVENYVRHLLLEILDTNFLYHNIDHTLRVVKSVEELTESHGLSQSDSETLLLAAW